MPARERAELARAAAVAPLRRCAAGSATPGPRIYAVASGKGGVGKSTVTANLAAALAARGQRVGVLDADVWGYSMPQLFGVRRSPVVLGEAMLPVPAHGVLLMSAGFFVDEDAPGRLAGADAAQGARAVPHATPAGDGWTRCSSTCRRAPATRRSRCSSCSRTPRCWRSPPRRPRPGWWPAGWPAWRRTAECRWPGWSRTWRRRSAAPAASTPRSSARAAGRSWPRRRACRCSGQVPLDVELRAAGDAGVPVVLAAPSSASARELTRIAATLPAPRRSLAGRPLPLSVVSPAR